MEKIYQIYTYNVTKNKTLYAYEEIEVKEILEIINGLNNKISRIRVMGIDNIERTYMTGRFFHVSTEIKPEYTNLATTNVMPYRADIMQDRVISKVMRDLGVRADVYKNCVLLCEKHGGYLQFLDEKTNKVLRIALNSNIVIA